MSLSFHSAEVTWLSPEAGVLPLPRRMSARRKKDTAVLAVLVTVTVVTVSAPFGPEPPLVFAVTLTELPGSECRAVRLPYWLIVACGLPRVEPQFTTSFWLDSQYTFRSTTVEPLRSTSSTNEVLAAAGGVVAPGTFGDRTPVRTCWLDSVIALTVWSSSTLPARSYTFDSTDSPLCDEPPRLSTVTLLLSYP